MKKLKSLLVTTVGILLFGNFYISASRASPVTSDCPQEYCKTYTSESDCLCVYNRSSKCYCELLSGGGVDCHLSCTAPDYMPERFIITIWIVIAIVSITIIGQILTPIILYITRTIKTRKLFGKIGEKKRYALIPIRNIYIRKKINKKKEKL